MLGRAEGAARSDMERAADDTIKAVATLPYGQGVVPPGHRRVRTLGLMKHVYSILGQYRQRDFVKL